MPNDPKGAAEKRTEPDKCQNAQGDHDGSAHRAEEFDGMNPQKPVPETVKPPKP